MAKRTKKKASAAARPSAVDASPAGKTSVIISGAAGRMGRRLLALASEEGFTIAGAVERPGHPAVGEDAGLLAGIPSLNISVTDDLETIAACLPAGRAPRAIVIEFSSPEATMAHVESAARLGLGAVIGTTGFSESDTERIRKIAAKIPIVLSPNMSVGVNAVFKLIVDAAKRLGPAYDVEIVETHHKLKKDAPSGTAMEMARRLAGALGRDLDRDGVFSRRGLIGERRPGEIGIQSLRGGDIIGDHTVLFAGPGERVEITHRAHSRDTFARGALRAAAWLVKKRPGFYTMADVLEI